MLRQYLGEDQDIFIAIKIVVGVLELHKCIKASELRLTCKALYLKNMNLLEDRPGSNHADTFKYRKYQQKRYKGKRHGELDGNPQNQAHTTSQAVVNRTNQDNNTTLQVLIIIIIDNQMC